MARRVRADGSEPAAPKGAAAAKGAAPGPNDLEVLRPDREVQIGPRVLTMREYRFWEGLQLEARFSAFFEDLYALFTRDEGAPGFDDVSCLLADHQEAAIAMVAQACDASVEWVAQLDDQDGDKLMVNWWTVNAGFFIRRVMRRAAKAQLAQALQSGGPAASTRSSPADTSATSTTSPA